MTRSFGDWVVEALPDHVTVFERGWLSSNNVLLVDGDDAVLIDSGYVTHAAQTVHLVRAAMGGRRLSRLVNTHLHSDHCGGNAALCLAYPGLRVSVPPGHFAQVQHWDAVALTHAPTGQQCARFSATDALHPGDTVFVGAYGWQVHAAPGHDPHSVVLFEPTSRILLSADALWENGFGVVFPELEGLNAFDHVAQTLGLIENLQPKIVVPGHGRPFSNVSRALDQARMRLTFFTQNPVQHAKHGVKVLIKFHMLEVQSCSMEQLYQWCGETEYLELIHERNFSALPFRAWIEGLIVGMCSSGTLRVDAESVHNL